MSLEAKIDIHKGRPPRRDSAAATEGHLQARPKVHDTSAWTRPDLSERHSLGSSSKTTRKTRSGRRNSDDRQHRHSTKRRHNRDTNGDDSTIDGRSISSNDQDDRHARRNSHGAGSTKHNLKRRRSNDQDQDDGIDDSDDESSGSNDSSDNGDASHRPEVYNAQGQRLVLSGNYKVKVDKKKNKNKPSTPKKPKQPDVLLFPTQKKLKTNVKKEQYVLQGLELLKAKNKQLPLSDDPTDSYFGIYVNFDRLCQRQHDSVTWDDLMPILRLFWSDSVGNKIMVDPEDLFAGKTNGLGLLIKIFQIVIRNHHINAIKPISKNHHRDLKKLKMDDLVDICQWMYAIVQACHEKIEDDPRSPHKQYRSPSVSASEVEIDRRRFTSSPEPQLATVKENGSKKRTIAKIKKTKKQEQIEQDILVLDEDGQPQADELESDSDDDNLPPIAQLGRIKGKGRVPGRLPLPTVQDGSGPCESPSKRQKQNHDVRKDDVPVLRQASSDRLSISQSPTRKIGAIGTDSDGRDASHDDDNLMQAFINDQQDNLVDVEQEQDDDTPTFIKPRQRVQNQMPKDDQEEEHAIQTQEEVHEQRLFVLAPCHDGQHLGRIPWPALVLHDSPEQDPSFRKDIDVMVLRLPDGQVFYVESDKLLPITSSTVLPDEIQVHEDKKAFQLGLHLARDVDGFEAWEKGRVQGQQQQES
ncbi:hypothetical protein OIO90_002899 [Microbotryomycetes sp. JL221]|nr:hypothetical protein OIO90_002899 [Microbotryomycetes sp. JL221]